MTQPVEVKFVRTHPDAKLPTKAHNEDNCWDLYAVEDMTIPHSTAYQMHKLDSNFAVNIGNAVVPVGLTVGYITPGFGFVIKGRSGMGFKSGIVPHFGEIDCVPAGTLIKTTQGDIPVEDVFLSNSCNIISFNEQSLVFEEDSIKDMWIVKDKELLEISLENTKVLIPKTKQLFTKRGWVSAQDLKVGEEVLTF